jgi:hypothetical protein
VDWTKLSVLDLFLCDTSVRTTQTVCYLFISFHLSVALQPPFFWALPLLQFRNLFFTQSVGLLGRGISPSQGRYLRTGQQKHRTNGHRHPCLEFNSNPRPQCSSEPRHAAGHCDRRLRIYSLIAWRNETLYWLTMPDTRRYEVFEQVASSPSWVLST